MLTLTVHALNGEMFFRVDHSGQTLVVIQNVVPDRSQVIVSNRFHNAGHQLHVSMRHTEIWRQKCDKNGYKKGDKRATKGD